MAFTDVLPLRASGLASCSGRHQLRSASLGRRGRAAVVRAQHRQQAEQQWHVSREAVSLACGVVQQQFIAGAPALADDMAAYDASGVSDSLKNAFGIAYVAVLIGFGIRLFNKRAKRFTTERLTSSDVDDLASAPAAESKSEAKRRPSPFAALYGAAQAAFLTVVLYTVATQLDAFFAAQQLPGQYTARNISITVRTVVQGLSYLLTFLFAANTVGLTGLAIQLVLFPDMELDGPKPQPRPGADLPKVSLTDDIGAIRKAFKELESQAQQRGTGSKGQP